MSETLPEEWRSRRDSAELLGSMLAARVIALELIVSVAGETRPLIYSGCLLRHNGLLHWITAGHCIDELEQIRSGDVDVEVARVRWCDNHETGAASTIPTSLDQMVWKFGEAGWDFGVVWIMPREAELLEANPSLRPFVDSECGWGGAVVEALIIFGFPREWVRIATAEEARGVRSMEGDFSLAGIPVKGEVPPDQRGEEPFWGFPECYYFKLADQDPEQPLSSIKGMSGGPLVAVEQLSDGTRSLRLVAIQSCWLASQRVVRAVRIEGVLAYLEYVFSEYRKALEAGGGGEA